MATKSNYEKNGIKYFRVTLDLGRDSDGNRIRKEFYGKSKKEAEKKRDDYKNGLNIGLSVDHDKLMLGNVFKIWLFEKVKNTVKPSTFERYEGIYRLYLEPSPLYSVKLKELKGLDIQRYYNKLFNDGKSSSIIKNLNKLLKSFLNYAVSEGYIFKNYCTGKCITIPEDTAANEDDEEEGTILVFSIEEQKEFIKAIDAHRLKALFLLDLGTGLRLGEITALKWTDLDLNNRTVSIKRTLKSVSLFEGDKKLYCLIEQAPKTKSSIRTIPIPENIIPILEQHKENQDKEINIANEIYEKNNYVFCTEIGTPIDPSNLRKTYERVLTKAKIEHKKFHSLRHTYATRLFEKEVPIKTVQILLGHSDISTTANIYTHVMPEEKNKAIDKINDLFTF